MSYLIYLCLLLFSGIIITLTVFLIKKNKDCRPTNTVKLSSIIEDNNLSSIIEDKNRFYKLKCKLTYKNEVIENTQSFIYQFDGTPLRSLLIMGISTKTNSFVQVSLLDSIKPYPPVSGAVYVSKIPWVPNIVPIDGGFMLDKFSNMLSINNKPDKYFQSFEDIIVNSKDTTDYQVKFKDSQILLNFYLE